MSKARVAVLISGSGSNLQALIDAGGAPDYPAQIALVIANKEDAYGLTRARNAGLATRVIAHRGYHDREAFDAALDAALREAGAEFVCLAGFMRILTPGFVGKWQGRMINIHPSLLPAFKGMHTHALALAAGVKIHGCTVHHVTPGVDDGPPIIQAAVPVLAGDTPESLGARVLAAEHVIYPLALRKLIDSEAELPNARQAVLING